MPKQPFVPVANCVRIKISGLNQTQPWVNLYSVRYIGAAPDNTTLNGFCNRIGSAWLTAFGGLVTTAVSVNRIDAWDLSSQQSAIGSDSTTRTGTAAVLNQLPLQSAVAISWPVPSRWRGGHFRTYMPARNSADISGGRTLVTAYHDAMLSAATSFRISLNSETMGSATVRHVGIRYFPTGVGVVRQTGTPFDTGVPIVHTRLDSQRRRSGKELV